MAPSYYITTPIYYVNDKPHIGHAYTSIAADALARFKRLDGYDVLFVTGTDEHGQKIAKAAEGAQTSPQAFCDQVSKTFFNLSSALNLSNDIFIRTTEERHQRAATALWKRMVEEGHIYKGSYAGWYAIRDEAYYSADELVEGRAPTGAEVEWIEEESYFFNLSKWQQPLLDFYQNNPSFIMPEGRRNEVIRFVERGLSDLSISRSAFRWGIPVPGDEKHVMYVWVDALTNYITALDFPDVQGKFKIFWPEAIHLVGKDILRFHAIYWPAFLMAVGLQPPQRVFAHGWWTVEGQKMSKSLKNTVDPLVFAQEFGVDALRYFLLREVPLGQDGNFSQGAFVQRYNSDLANDLGNLSQRVLAFVQKNASGVVPTPGKFLAVDKALLQQSQACLQDLRQWADVQALSRMLEAIWRLIGAANRYVDEQAPWNLKKTDPRRMETVLYVLMEGLRYIGLYVLPFMPETASKLLDLLNVDKAHRTFATHKPLEVGVSLPEPTGLFPRLG